jgi:1-acyl-sn-glycerol-3-phosphate acyltransferase
MASSHALDARVGALPAPLGVPRLYRLFQDPLRRLLRLSFDLAVEDADAVPGHGPCVLAANHHNYLDGLVLAVSVARPISFLVMPRVWSATPLHPFLHRLVGSIRLEVDRPDVGALRQALGALAAGQVVGIFPEGPSSVRGHLEAGRNGVALLALRSGAPVVPVGIRGTYEALVGRRAYVPRRHPIRVRFGAPILFTPGPDDGPRALRGRVTARIMDAIAALLA